MALSDETAIYIAHSKCNLDISDIADPAWKHAETVLINNYWSGEPAPAGRHVNAKVLWSGDAIYVHFSASQVEPLVINSNTDLKQKTVGLWERDVCEVFIAPDPSEPRKYFEFEAAPTGEWLDLAIHLSSGERVTDWNYRSGLETFAVIEEELITIVLKIPMAGLGLKPEAGMRCRGNLFRCVGSGATRGYLSWRPTFTARPDFHVPERFGEFVFG